MTSDPDRYRVWLHDRAIGWLNRHDDYVWFEFDEGYLGDPDRAVLGLRFEENPRGRVAANLRLPPWFSNLLPEGQLREWIALDRGVSADRELELLLQVGGDLPGAVRVLPPGEEPVPELARPDEIGDSKAGSADRSWRFSLAGVGLKFSMLRAGERFTCAATGRGGDWIVKLPDPIFPQVPRNEYTMMRWAEAIGIEVPNVVLIHRDEIDGLPEPSWRSSETFAYGVRRFDRERRRLVHIEDFAQVAGVYADRKFEGNYESVASFAYRGYDIDALAEFARRLTFFVLVGNGDAHLKNWSLIYRDGRVPTLSPAYDIVATQPYLPGPGEEQLALKFVGSRRFEAVRIAHFQRLARRLDAEIDLAAVVQVVVERAVEEWPRVEIELADHPFLRETVDRTLAQRASSLLGGTP